MKRVKLVLTAIAAIGIVGGALAFKAKTFGNASKYCYTTTTASGASCVLTVSNAKFLPGSDLVKYVTITTGNCVSGRACSKIADTFAL